MNACAQNLKSAKINILQTFPHPSIQMIHFMHPINDIFRTIKDHNIQI